MTLRNHILLFLSFLILSSRFQGNHGLEVTTTAEGLGSYDEDKEGDDDAEAAVSGLDPALQIPYGKLCESAEACKGYPNVECVLDSLRVSTCRCNYLKTFDKQAKHCVLNVFSPCSAGR
jgi:hypothetical protein